MRPGTSPWVIVKTVTGGCLDLDAGHVRWVVAPFHSDHVVLFRPPLPCKTVLCTPLANADKVADRYAREIVSLCALRAELSSPGAVPLQVFIADGRP